VPSLNNKTRRPLSVPLPGGKKLRLGPLQTGQVTAKALEHPPLKALIEAGELELAVENRQRTGRGGAGKASGPGRGRDASSGVQQTGDR